MRAGFDRTLLFAGIFAALLAAACESGGSKKGRSDTSATTATDASDGQDATDGQDGVSLDGTDGTTGPSADGTGDGQDATDGVSDGQDASDGARDGQDATDGVSDGQDATDGVSDGQDATDGATDGQDATDGQADGASVGDACVTGADCAGNTCIPMGDGYCSQSSCDTKGCPPGATCAEFQGGATYCLRSCGTDADCEPGQACDADGTCWFSDTVAPTGDGSVGAPCATNADCKDAGAVCYPYLADGSPTGFVNGYCLIFDCTADSCPAGSTCLEVSADGGTACVASCSSTADCRADEGYSCFEPGICFPGCGGDATCPTGTACDAEEQTCQPACTATSCPGDQVCKPSGLCGAPPCTANSCGAGFICAASGDCVPDLEGGPGVGPGPTCPNLPTRDCTGGESTCGAITQFEPVDGPGYTNYPLNGETTQNQYRSFARKDLQMLVKYAAAWVDCKAATWGGGNGEPLGLGDMSEANGDIPGTSIGNPGHPAGTHVDGYDMDIAYFQNTGTNNYLKPICEHMSGGQDQYHCVAQPDILDVWRTALFLGALLSSPRTRVIGIDGKVGQLVTQALEVLCANDWVPAGGCAKINYLAYEVTDGGLGWYYFHHHHLHVSLFQVAGKPGAPQSMDRCLISGCPQLSEPGIDHCIAGDGMHGTIHALPNALWKNRPRL
ncbi:MAG: hypothetical protein IV100_19725 [Myxococcales bacterium]|nr:hypothetical protein [Myxococcales bacterium]